MGFIQNFTQHAVGMSDAASCQARRFNLPPSHRGYFVPPHAALGHLQATTIQSLILSLPTLIAHSAPPPPPCSTSHFPPRTLGPKARNCLSAAKRQPAALPPLPVSKHTFTCLDSPILEPLLSREYLPEAIARSSVPTFRKYLLRGSSTSPTPLQQRKSRESASCKYG